LVPHFFRYTFTPIFTSSLPGTDTFPSVEAIVIDFPDFDSPNSFERSTVITSHRRQVNFENRLPPAALMTAVR